MRPVKKADKPEDYERFKALTKALIAVPKAEIQAEAEKHENAKKARRSAQALPVSAA